LPLEQFPGKASLMNEPEDLPTNIIFGMLSGKKA